MRAALILLTQCCSLASAAETKRYGIVFDAGSSGSRIHVYTWKTGGPPPKTAFDLVSDDLLKVKPGLSAYKDTPSQAGTSLAQLIDFAKTKIPADQVASTPMFLMATAGLRMVGEAAKDAILASVCSYLSSTGFIFKCAWAGVLDGHDEGLYGWVTVNYLLDALYAPSDASATPTEPKGIIDLGGGSVQIVFPTDASVAQTAPPGYIQSLSFGERKHSLYVHSHLGFGLDAARNAVSDRAATLGSHPCVPVGASITHKGQTIPGSGDYKKCKRLTKAIFGDEHEECKYGKHMCSFKGTYQPRLPRTFYGFSYFYDRTGAIGLLDGEPATFGQQRMSRDDIEHKAKDLCALDSAATTAKFAKAGDASKAANFCGDVVYLAVLLDELGFDDEAALTMTNKIKDVELVWTLGAMLAKSAELQAGDGGGAGGGGFLRTAALLLLAAGTCWACCRRQPSTHGHLPLRSAKPGFPP